ncbi:hypothetical protein P5673_002729 [Acropora cervicornis]|uniref:Uncharacterized protein n=1 Tax=Acropora cervicornis TaxID=6130 RepID=A0AAD9VFB3_ACRCE|nr:hypothetical protein P5673_002729 [Acropora cervicornis]
MLGCKICEELGFVTKKTLLSSYLDRFKGLGTFKDMKPYRITLDPAAEPVIHPPRSVPVHRKELDDMLNLGVIAPVDRPTDWVNTSPIKPQQIRNERFNDPAFSKLREVIHEGEKFPKTFHNFWKFCEELAIEDGLILKQERIVMPTTIRRDTLNTIQHGHLGQEKCLLLARSVVFRPGITKDVTSL